MIHNSETREREREREKNSLVFSNGKNSEYILFVAFNSKFWFEKYLLFLGVFIYRQTDDDDN